MFFDRVMAVDEVLARRHQNEKDEWLIQWVDPDGLGSELRKSWETRDSLTRNSLTETQFDGAGKTTNGAEVLDAMEAQA